MVLRHCALVAVLVALFFPLRAAAATYGLKGVSVVGVLVERVSAEAQRAGLTEDQLLQDVQLKLRQNGLKVVDNDQAGGMKLYLNVSCYFLEQRRQFVYSILLGFNQPVVPERQPGTVVLALTWFNGAMGIIPEAELRTGIREKTADLVDSFVNAYLAENPKK
jgi:hypothetical protein